VSRPIVLAVGLVACAPGLARADAEPRAFHVDVDLSFASLRVGYLSTGDFAPICPDGRLASACRVDGFRAPVLSASAGFGFEAFSLEAGFARAVQGVGRFGAMHAGVRFDTSYRAPFALFFRAGYLRRGGDDGGAGARMGLGLQIRIAHAFVLYGEASAAVLSVPGTMRDNGTIFSWSYGLGGGVRIVMAARRRSDAEPIEPAGDPVLVHDRSPAHDGPAGALAAPSPGARPADHDGW
jgi:hypothetical protein